MIVVSIIKLKYKPRCRVILDTGDFYDFSTDLILKYSILKNQPFTDKVFNLLNAEQRIIDAKQTAYNYASYKPRTIKQTIEKLKLKEFNPEEIDLAIAFLKDFNLLDDVRFARDFIPMYIKKKPSGKQRIILELYKRGVPKDIIHESIEEYFPEEDNLTIALQAAEKKMRSVSRKPIDKQKSTLASFLQRQGFDWHVIKQTLTHFFRDN